VWLTPQVHGAATRPRDTGPMEVRHFADAQAALDQAAAPLGAAGAEGEPFARAWRDVAGAQVEVRRDLHAFELRVVRRPAMPAGCFRPAADGDVAVLERWALAFAEAIDEPLSPADASQTVARMLPNDDLVVWERDGEVVSMAAVVRRTPWSSSVAYVYTPPPLRGRGFASAVVAELSQRELDAGQSWCSLFTDAANPTSNHIYTEIGYEPRCDFRHLSVTERRYSA
jgi:predicted GNAT family acetyltransferase